MTEGKLQQVRAFSQGEVAASFLNAGSLHEIIERQALASPNAPGLFFEGKILSYGELNRRANQLAHHLIGLGIDSNDVVGICAQRSIEMVLALLGILKAGGAYLPLDPEYPFERLKLMVQDATPRVILSQKALRGIAEFAGVSTICLDSEWAAIAGESTTNPGVPLRPSDAAYIIYTSGSTGLPKGVVNTHAGIVNRLMWMQDAYPLSCTDRVLQKTPYSFDVSVWEFFWPLIAGAQLVVARPEGHRDPEYLLEMIKQGITHLHFVPSMLGVFLETVELPKHSSLRQVFCSGETLTASLQRMFFLACDASLMNLYGPTEAAVEVTYWNCQRDDARNFVPIGRPIKNIQIHILDEHLEPVPIGIRGELYIGGVGVARGYLNRPELTAERFIADPFSKEPSARLYKTGDMARFLPTGEIEYLGRIDQQVKIRGFRIELGEIEFAIAQHASVRDVAVITQGSGLAQRLVAYLVVTSPQPDVSSLRKHLKITLPEYMIPSAFVFLERMPMTISGKVDRKGLTVQKSLHPSEPTAH